LESYPEVNRIWMGLEEGSIRPAAYQKVRSIMDGYLSLQAKDGQLLKKGELWAVFDLEQIEIERSNLDLEEEKLELQLRKDSEDFREAHISLQLELHEAESKRQALLDASENPSIPTDLRKRAGEAILKMDERLDLLRQKAAPETMDRELKIKETEGRLLITRQRKQFLALEKRSRLIAEFDGELRLSNTIKKAIEEKKDAEGADALIWVASNQHIATIVNDDKFEIVVTAASPLLSQIQREELLVYLQEPRTGRLIAGDYARTDEVDTGGEILQKFVFTIQDDSIEDARHSSGQRGLVHIYRKFQQPVRLIHKKDIAFAAADILATSGWDGLVRNLWPGSTVIQVGPQTIAVMSDNEN